MDRTTEAIINLSLPLLSTNWNQSKWIKTLVSMLRNQNKCWEKSPGFNKKNLRNIAFLYGTTESLHPITDYWRPFPFSNCGILLGSPGRWKQQQLNYYKKKKRRGSETRLEHWLSNRTRKIMFRKTFKIVRCILLSFQWCVIVATHKFEDKDLEIMPLQFFYCFTGSWEIM